jgi:hypothetical protein
VDDVPLLQVVVRESFLDMRAKGRNCRQDYLRLESELDPRVSSGLACF